MKIINQIIVYDVYVVCADDEDPQVAARAAVMSHVRHQTQPMRESESNSLEVQHEREIRSAWLGERPIVSDGVSDADFELLKGKTVREVYMMLHTKEASTAPKPAKKAAGAK